MVDPVSGETAPGGETAVACAVCGETAADGARFCERCGAPIGTIMGADPASSPASTAADTPDRSSPEDSIATESLVLDAAGQPSKGTARACVRCGGRIADDGYCEQCGEPAVNPRDHWAERPADWVGGVCDRGVRHFRNEDAMALAADAEPGSFAVLVVCDGVSSSADSDIASLAAARAALAVLAAGGPDGKEPIGGSVTERMSAWSARIDVAAVAADDAIRDAIRSIGDDAAGPTADTPTDATPATPTGTTPDAPPGTATGTQAGPTPDAPPGTAADGASHEENPPSCTFVVAVVDGPLVVTGWIGDSRAYWLPDVGPAHQLSVDDSWAQEMIAQGMSRASAESAPQAHAITKWLGPDAPLVDAQTAPTLPDSPGWVLVCSDGLWNYCSQAYDLADLVRRTQATTGPDPQALARALVDWANAQGGRDNVTVTFARFEPRRAAGTLPDESDHRTSAAATSPAH